MICSFESQNVIQNCKTINFNAMVEMCYITRTQLKFFFPSWMIKFWLKSFSYKKEGNKEIQASKKIS